MPATQGTHHLFRGIDRTAGPSPRSSRSKLTGSPPGPSSSAWLWPGPISSSTSFQRRDPVPAVAEAPDGPHSFEYICRTLAAGPKRSSTSCGNVTPGPTPAGGWIRKPVGRGRSQFLQKAEIGLHDTVPDHMNRSRHVLDRSLDGRLYPVSAAVKAFQGG